MLNKQNMTLKELKQKFPQFVIKEEKENIVVYLGEDYKYKLQYEWKLIQCIYPKENLILKK